MANELLNEMDVVALLSDLPQENLFAGQTGAVVYVHSGAEAYEVEFFSSPRRSTVVTVRRDQLLKLKGLPDVRIGAA